MPGALAAIAERLTPEVRGLREHERTSVRADVLGVLYAGPLAVAGLAWLVAATDLALLRARWPILLLLLALMLPFRRLYFFILIEVRSESADVADYVATLEPVVIWSAVLLFGPSALWLAVFWGAAELWRTRQFLRGPLSRWNRLRNTSLRLAEDTVAPLLALALYQWAGGTYPLPGLALAAVGPAVLATAAWLLLSTALLAPLFAYFGRHWTEVAGGAPYSRFLLPALLVSAVTQLASLFAILAAGLYVQSGLGAYLFYMLGVLAAALGAHQLSRAAERNRRWSGEMAKLERLGRGILAGPPDGSALPDLLAQHVPGFFPRATISIRLFPDRTLLHAPANAPAVPPAAWEWLAGAAKPQAFAPGESLPWAEEPAQEAQAVAPIMDGESGRAVGGIHVALHGVLPYISQDVVPAADLLPVIQSLAALIASALDGAEAYARTLAHERLMQELAVARKIQQSLLPAELPRLSGWEVAAYLAPARETSGDYYDLIPLPDGHLGLLIADVADKGVGAALYMALSRSLIRASAVEHSVHPGQALASANRRILADSRSDMFVTVFYGVLDPASGLFTYASAGHNPPYRLPAQGTAVEPLPRTGLPLGILEDASWEERSLQLGPGDRLLLYTDGVTEAQDAQGGYFGVERMLEAAQESAHAPAEAMQEALLAALQRFVGDAPQADDITLLILARKLPQDGRHPAAGRAVGLV